MHLQTAGTERKAAVSRQEIHTLMERIHAWEPSIMAWAYIDAATTGRIADWHMPGAMQDLPLQGIPFGVKDVIDVAGLPTRYGSDAFADAGPAKQDAAIVALLRRAGAIPIGKTRSTEFAFVDPTITRNPFDPRRSPGGSSSGSGAVVGAGLVPFALGTQTAGSLCRPAVYCGATAYKPSLQALPSDGMAPLSPAFDTIGVIAASMPWLLRIFAVVADGFSLPPAMSAIAARKLRIGLLVSPEQSPGDDMRQMMQTTIGLLRAAGHSVDQSITPVSFAAIIAQHRIVMLAEAAEHIGAKTRGREALLKPLLRAALQEGRKISAMQKADALVWLAESRADFWRKLADYDLLLAYPVPEAAPLGLGSTGDQSYLTPWTALGGPLVSLPAGQNAQGLPLGILLASPHGTDAALMQAAAAIADILPPPITARLAATADR